MVGGAAGRRAGAVNTRFKAEKFIIERTRIGRQGE